MIRHSGIGAFWHWVRANPMITRLLSLPRTQLLLGLTLILVLLHGIDEFMWTTLPARCLAVAMLLSREWLRSRWAWLGLAVLLGGHTIWAWSALVNHDYMIAYWVGVCAIAVWSKAPKHVFAWNARLLIGLCFLFATAWKLISGEYLDGSFLHLTFLLDARLEMGAALLGGVSLDALAANRDLFESLGIVTPATLETTPLLSTISVVLSYWTILIEGLVALAFLAPGIKYLYDNREWVLLLFIVTTYTVIPVLGFGGILFIMGLAQCKQPNRQKIYLTLLLLMPIWMPLPQALFYVAGRFLGTS
ncbi:MAG: hypothetical protein AAFV72_11415 [Cyanobacteria bacterium J06635_1]